MADNAQGWTSSPDGRGSMDIIFSSLATFGLCSWSVICVNIPPPHTSYYMNIFRKVWLTLICLLGPEFTLVAAMGQWHSARRTLRAFNRKGLEPWSLRHAFCAEMGFWWAETRDNVRWPLNGKALVYLMENEHIDPNSRRELHISKEAIDDLNKYDGFARTLAQAQSAWFTINCLARFAQGLPITTLELTVLAFFVPALGIVFFWKDKPSDIHTTRTLRLSSTVEELRQIALAQGHIRTSEPWFETPLDFVARDEWHGSLIYTYWLNTPLFAFGRKMFLGADGSAKPIISMSDMALPPLSLGLEFVEAAFSVPFLGINFVAWFWHFPTPVEQWLWRISSLALCFTFGLGCLAHFLCYLWHPIEKAQAEARQQRAAEKKSWWTKLAVRLRNNSPNDDPDLDVPLRILLPGLPLMLLYVVCRLYIFVEDGLAFRSQPSGVYESIDWMQYLPHIG
ncbi:hypothetical protein BU24DRAFT_425632 [Aaosphaeria arxii CBS 175.79]|uniref:Uncharacterized protein n=1 Tax=Aaosphaeria arxii CBS 175.79 TaxID=1450172 RepID=A0A6A5XJL2_9PLEO|nr:uncharacterized protein BU24DRAFT_425632 [Aaosphaeria arxii CBS 175.79]KAF2013069.1 hypothetical protein BU24DRAFT_425632 [Aaosphaeria arxii CBS 175.79]